MADEKRFTGKMQCGHCQNIAPMSIEATYDGIESHDDGPYEWSAGDVYELLKCPACRDVTLRHYYWHDHMDPSDAEFSIRYPQKTKDVRGLPPKVEKAYQAANRVRKIDVNAYGVLLGRVLDLVCEDRGATGGTLDNRLKSLADSGEIPQKLVDVAAGLRQMRNIGAHADLGELTEEELPVLDDLTAAILDYVYSATYLANTAAQRLAKLKKPKKTAKKTA